MKKTFTLLATLIPSAAWAHPGHEGVGIFHHMFDLLPIIAVIILAAAIVIWKKRH